MSPLYQDANAPHCVRESIRKAQWGVTIFLIPWARFVIRRGFGRLINSCEANKGLFNCSNRIGRHGLWRPRLGTGRCGLIELGCDTDGRGAAHRGRTRVNSIVQARSLDRQTTLRRQISCERQQEATFDDNGRQNLTRKWGTKDRVSAMTLSWPSRSVAAQILIIARLTSHSVRERSLKTHHSTQMSLGFSVRKASGNTTKSDNSQNGNSMATLSPFMRSIAWILAAPGRHQGLRLVLPMIRMQSDSSGDVDG